MSIRMAAKHTGPRFPGESQHYAGATELVVNKGMRIKLREKGHSIGAAATGKSLFVSLSAMTLTVFTACASMSESQQGELIGGVIGGVVGSQIGEGHGRTAAIIVGTLAGAVIGRHIGETMDDSDRARTAQTLNDARTGQSRSWVNPDSGYEYTITPTRTYEQSGTPCREFSLITAAGHPSREEMNGNACLQADGSWLVQ